MNKRNTKGPGKKLYELKEASYLKGGHGSLHRIVPCGSRLFRNITMHDYRYEFQARRSFDLTTFGRSFHHLFHTLSSNNFIDSFARWLNHKTTVQ